MNTLAELNEKQIADTRLRDHLRSLAALAEAGGWATRAAQIFENHWPTALHRVSAIDGLRSRSAVPPGTTDPTSPESPLANPWTPLQ